MDIPTFRRRNRGSETLSHWPDVCSRAVSGPGGRVRLQTQAPLLPDPVGCGSGPQRGSAQSCPAGPGGLSGGLAAGPALCLVGSTMCFSRPLRQCSLHPKTPTRPGPLHPILSRGAQAPTLGLPLFLSSPPRDGGAAAEGFHQIFADNRAGPAWESTHQPDIPTDNKTVLKLGLVKRQAGTTPPQRSPLRLGRGPGRNFKLVRSDPAPLPGD